MEINTNPTKRTLFLIFFAVLIWWLFDNFKFVGKIINFSLEILSPFIIGLTVAFILNKPMSFLERKLFGEKAPFSKLKEKYKRPLSLIITLILSLSLLAIVLTIAIPNIIKAGAELAQTLPKHWENIQKFIESSVIQHSQINNWVQEIDFTKITSGLSSFITGGLSNWLGSTFTIFSSVISSIVSIGLGLVFSVYFLLQKETLTLNIRKIVFAVFPTNVAKRTIYIGKITHDSFSQFLTGQTLDALALGGLFFVSMLLFKFPYALVVSLIIALSAFIPIVGSFVGLVIGAFLILAESAKMAGLFIILFFVLQQIEGNLIYPRIVGKASGLSPVWILAAVTLGGSLMGILGIILFVPIFSVLQKLLQEYTDKRLEEKSIHAFED